MTTAFARTFVGKGNLVAVEVQGLPSSATDPVYTYYAHADVGVGDLVLVDAPAWSVRVTNHTQLPGFVLGPADPGTVAHLKSGQIKTLRATLVPAGSDLAVPHLNGNAVQTIAAWNDQADALEAAAGHIRDAVRLLEQAAKR